VLREIGFPWSPAMAERALRSVGATVAAARVAMIEGLAANLAGGTHHAYAHKGGGFCVFNDLAVAARVLQAEWGRSRHPDGSRRQPLQVAVIDLDVHQGNGTASIFRDDESVFTLSLHGDKNFPFRKEDSDLEHSAARWLRGRGVPEHPGACLARARRPLHPWHGVLFGRCGPA